MRPVPDERGCHLRAIVEAGAIGRGGIPRAAEAAGLSRATGRRDVKGAASGDAAPSDGRTRKPVGRGPKYRPVAVSARDPADPGPGGPYLTASAA
ncbi:MAG: hypothetical protein OXE82_11220 [Rhodobacter sp.]|nr:hypothetical protein [Rhodobacter sp.]